MRTSFLADGMAVRVEPTKAERADIAKLATAIARIAAEHDGRVHYHQLLAAGFDPEFIAAYHPHALPRAARSLAGRALAHDAGALPLAA